MQFLAPLLAPAVLLFPLFGNAEVGSENRLTARSAIEQPSGRNAISWFDTVVQSQVPRANQVRIEQRVILRISPRPGARQDMAAALQSTRGRSRLVERSFGECLPVAQIAAVQVQRGNRLLLHLRDRRLLSAELEKACSAQNYYSGFYLERNDDGRLCVDRDRLQARNGTKCSVSSLRQIVAVPAD
ncbi:hypothetical protein [Qipengyuania sp. MTN3-11]|uniref:hypothetical protein n=1 Tax=Qipengyuania sp. MTN3-11 TaxID=3056557 RepID=UPI0036F23EA2